MLSLPAIARPQTAYPPNASPQSNPSTSISSSPALSAQKALEDALKKQRASLETQRQALHRQLAQTGEKTDLSPYPVEQFIVPFPTVSQPDCPPLDAGRVNDLVAAAAQKQSLDPALLRAVIKQESGFKPCAVSFKGAQGLMQLMPGTARDLHVTNVFDPVQNVQGGAAYLKQLLARYKGDLRLALVGYNAGPGRADQPTGEPYPLETQNYVASILSDLGIETPDGDTVKEDLAPADETEAEAAPVVSSPMKIEIDMNPPVIQPISLQPSKAPISKP
jgi:hypothetical protein